MILKQNQTYGVCVRSVDDNCFDLWEEQEPKIKTNGRIHLLLHWWVSIFLFLQTKRMLMMVEFEICREKKGWRGGFCNHQILGVCAVGRSRAEIYNKPRRDFSAEWDPVVSVQLDNNEQIVAFSERTAGNHQCYKASQELPLLKSRGINECLHLFQASAAWSQRDKQGKDPGLEGCIPAGFFVLPAFSKATGNWGESRLPGSLENLVGLQPSRPGFWHLTFKFTSSFKSRFPFIFSKKWKQDD